MTLAKKVLPVVTFACAIVLDLYRFSHGLLKMSHMELVTDNLAVVLMATGVIIGIGGAISLIISKSRFNIAFSLATILLMVEFLVTLLAVLST